jgi:phthalate 4,5-cis-dihydrodiol dehydrogenase
MMATAKKASGQIEGANMTASDRTLRFGIAGLGPGAMTLLGGFAHNPHVKLTAAADVRPQALEAFGKDYGVETFSSVEAMCASPNVDAVYVVTPTPLHAEHVITAAEHKKHIIVSKPMAVTQEECDAMSAAAERNGVKFVCGHTQSLLTPILKMAEVVWSGEFGRLGMLHTWHYTDWIYRPRRPYELDVNVGGGVVYRQSPHQIDILRLICGEKVKSVRATVMNLDPKRDAPGAYTVFLQFEDGTPATIVYSGYGHFSANEITFGRTPQLRSTAKSSEEEEALKNASGYVPGRGAAATATRSDESPFSTFGLTLATCEKADIRQSPKGLWIYEEGGRRELEIPPDAARGEAEFEELYQAVVNDVPPLHDGRWGAATHEITLAIMQSSREGREIALTRQTAIPAERRR